MPSHEKACGAKPQALLPPSEGWAVTTTGYTSFKYSHRKGDCLLDLLKELVRWPHVNHSETSHRRRALDDLVVKLSDL